MDQKSQCAVYTHTAYLGWRTGGGPGPTSLCSVLKCENVYNSDQADRGNVPSRCVGCKQRIVVDLDKKKASEYLD